MPKLFQQRSESDLISGNAKELLSDSLMRNWQNDGGKNAWIGFVTEDVFYFYFILLGNILKMCFSVNVPCVLK